MAARQNHSPGGTARTYVELDNRIQNPGRRRREHRGRLDASPSRLAARRPLERHGDGDRLDPVAAADAAADRHRCRLRRAHLVSATLVEDLPAGRPVPPLHPQSGLLGGDDPEPYPGPRRLRGLHGHRRSDRHLRRPPAGLLPGDRADPRPDADPADLRLPRPHHRLLRHRHGAGPARHGGLRAAGADPDDPARGQRDTRRADRGGRGLRRHRPPETLEGGAALCLSRRSWSG